MDTDRKAIEHLMAEYCLRIDGGDFEGFAQLFEHGSWTVLGDPNGGDHGSEAVLATLQNVIRYDGKPNTKHVMSNVLIDIHENKQIASAQCYITVFQAVPPEFPLQAIFIGHYNDRFERLNGEWCIRSRDISPDLPGDLSFHRSDMA